MLDYAGVSSYSLGEAAGEKRKTDGEVASKPTSNLSNNTPFQLNNGPSVDYSTFQFKRGVDNPTQFQNALTPPRLDLVSAQTRQSITPVGLLPGVMMQLMNANLEKLAGQVMSFFNGNRREKPTEEDQLKRNLNDAFGQGLLGEVIKVEAPHKGQMENGEGG